ncbi:FkbM family methyltransferase [Algoriphagus alkaliphilus]|uniref:FkbM family methyltransferase n=1 Tax=Algoriphagus alkaliphilus TaxID=279824 RepID=UPI0015875E06|nr:FkbM family methyltransferase [Algoriphagus alkaliphilus]
MEEKRIEKFYADLFNGRLSLIFDIGANVGIRTSVFSSLGNKVVVLEPNRELVSILNSRFSRSNVEVIDKACAASSGTREFHLGDNHLVSTLSTQFIHHKQESGAKNKWAKKSQIKTISLDELVKIYGVPDFCKIDVEGYEKEVLSGLNQKIGMISFEFNYPAFESDTLWCLEKLSSLGYTSFNFSLGETLEFHFSEWVSYEDISAIFHLKNFPFGTCYGDIYAR